MPVLNFKKVDNYQLTRTECSHVYLVEVSKRTFCGMIVSDASSNNDNKMLIKQTFDEDFI